MATQPPDENRTFSLARRRAAVWVLGIVFGAAFLAVLVHYKGLINVEDFGLSEGRLYAIGFPLAFGALALLFVIWRCPGCGSYLGKEIRPPFCSNCGALFK